MGGVAYVRSMYNLPKVKRGLRIKYNGEVGKITSFSNYIHVKIYGKSGVRRIHPEDEKLEFLY